MKLRNIIIAIVCLCGIPVQAGNLPLRLQAEDPTEPWFTVSAQTIATANCAVGDTILVKTYTVQQGNLTAPVTVEMLGTHRDQWFLDKTQLTTDGETVNLYYTPTKVGNHRATLFFDCTAATTYSTTFPQTGTATNPTVVPAITLNPTMLPDFKAIVGQSVYDTILVNATNCTATVNIVLTNHETPGAFTINNTQMPANVQNELSIVTFSPLTAGTYTATITYSTAGGKTQTITVTGIATPKVDPIDPGYDTTFHFVDTTALTYLEEHFDTAGHNTPLSLQGWQNVVCSGRHGWWTIDRVNDEDMLCAKATAFVSGMSDTTTWEMWLVTPALDYVNTTSKVFTFRVRGDYIYDDMPTALELYYIDATDTTDIYRELIEAAIPKTSDERGQWIDVVVDLSGLTTIADTFHFGFRYIGPGGIDGAPTYYIDDITWGNQPQGISNTTNHGEVRKTIENGKLILHRGRVRYDATGARL